MFLVRLPPSMHETVGAGNHMTAAAMVKSADAPWDTQCGHGHDPTVAAATTQRSRSPASQGCGAGAGTGTGTGRNRIHLGTLEPEPYSEYGSGSEYKEMKQTTKKN